MEIRRVKSKWQVVDALGRVCSTHKTRTEAVRRIELSEAEKSLSRCQYGKGESPTLRQQELINAERRRLGKKPIEFADL